MNPQILSQAATVDLFPQDFDDQVEMSILNRLRDLVSQKMALDNEGNSEIDVTDPSITYAEFAVFETLTDEEERQGREKEFEHYKRAQGYSKDRYVFADVNRTGGSLDFIVAQAEAKKREILGENAREMHHNSPVRGNQNDLSASNLFVFSRLTASVCAKMALHKLPPGADPVIIVYDRLAFSKGVKHVYVRLSHPHNTQKRPREIVLQTTRFRLYARPSRRLYRSNRQIGAF